MDYILQTRNVSVNYGRFHALRDFSLTVPRGAIYGLVGKNGSGKTTFFRTVARLLFPAAGEIENRAAKMAAIVETPAIYMDMTAVQNMSYQCDLLGIRDKTCIKELLELVGLADVGKKKAVQFSLGMRQRLGLAIALLGETELLLLDEPLNGLDPQGIIELRELIVKLNREKGITFMISSHILEELAKLATHYGFVDQGRVIEEIDVSMLEEKFEKHTVARVSDVEVLTDYLAEQGFSYKLLEHGEVDFVGEMCVTAFVKALDARGCEVYSLFSVKEELENYYLKLLGGNA